MSCEKHRKNGVEPTVTWRREVNPGNLVILVIPAVILVTPMVASAENLNAFLSILHRRWSGRGHEASAKLELFFVDVQGSDPVVQGGWWNAKPSRRP